MAVKLIPRLNYNFSFSDLMIQFAGMLKHRVEPLVLNNIFRSKTIFYINSARSGMYLSLSSLQLETNAKVAVVGYNCHTVANSIIQAGLTPVFIDITDDFIIDLKDLEKKKEGLKAIIVTHLFGMPADVKQIRNLCPGISVIEDCAHAFLSKNSKDEYLGNEGDFAVFSIGYAKFPSIGKGGFVVVNNPSFVSVITEKVATLPKYTLNKEINLFIKKMILVLLHKPLLYKTISYKLKKRNGLSLNDIKEDVNLLQIPKGDLYLFSKKANNLQYLKEVQSKTAELFYGTIKIKKPQSDVNNFMMPVLYKKDRDALVLSGINNGIEIGTHFSNSIGWAKEFGYVLGTCPNAEKIAKELITIPCHYGLKKQQVLKINKFLAEIKFN